MASLIKISSLGHSGSTMLDLMLGHHSRAFSCGEVYAYYYPFQPFHFRTPAGEESIGADMWDFMETTPKQAYHQRVAQEFDVDFVVESAKNLVWLVDSVKAARRTGMPVANLLLWKRPEVLAYSYWRRERPVAYWLPAYKRYYERFFSTGLPFATISYDDLVREPVQTLQRIGKAVGMDIEAGQEAFWNGDYRHLFGNQGTRRQVGTSSTFRHPEDNYPDEFQAALPAIRQAIEADEEVQDLVERLAAARLDGDLPIEFDPHSIRRPVWYWTGKARMGGRALLTRAKHRLSD